MTPSSSAPARSSPLLAICLVLFVLTYSSSTMAGSLVANDAQSRQEQADGSIEAALGSFATEKAETDEVLEAEAERLSPLLVTAGVGATASALALVGCMGCWGVSLVAEDDSVPLNRADLVLLVAPLVVPIAAACGVAGGGVAGVGLKASERPRQAVPPLVRFIDTLFPALLWNAVFGVGTAAIGVAVGFAAGFAMLTVVSGRGPRAPVTAAVAAASGIAIAVVTLIGTAAESLVVVFAPARHELEPRGRSAELRLSTGNIEQADSEPLAVAF